ncbi:hypothetical protein M5D96_005424, partial [Drosophila gunungcola]
NICFFSFTGSAERRFAFVAYSAINYFWREHLLLAFDPPDNTTATTITTTATTSEVRACAQQGKWKMLQPQRSIYSPSYTRLYHTQINKCRTIEI